MMFKNRYKNLCVGLLAAAATFGLLACGDEVQPLESGAMSVNWEVSPRGCVHAEVTRVEVQLTNDHRQYTKSFECELSFGYMDNVEAGHYTLALFGSDVTGLVTFESTPKSVTVRGDTTNTLDDPVRLTAKPASLEVEWSFDNGRLCGSNGVEKIEIAIYNAGDFEVAREEFSCNLGAGVLQGFSAGEYLVEATAVAGGVLAFRGEKTVSLTRGEEGYVRLSLADH